MSRHVWTVAAICAVSCSSTAKAAPFAIACTGSAEFMDKLKGQTSERSYELPKQVYVFDEGSKRVQRAMESRQEFEDVCFRDGYINDVIFSPGLISVRSEKAGRLCDFKVNRKSGEAEFFSHTDFRAGDYSKIQFRMICEPTAVPAFDSSKNKF